MDDVTGEYIAVPYRVPHPDMTLAESEAARQAATGAQSCGPDRGRLFENVLQVRAIEERGRTATARMKAERSRQARRTACATNTARSCSIGHRTRDAAANLCAPPAAMIAPFADVEDL